MKNHSPTAGALRAARQLYNVENPGPYYGLEGLATVIDSETAATAMLEALNLALVVVARDVRQGSCPSGVENAIRAAIAAASRK